MIEEALLNILKNDAAISAIASDRVYPVYVPQGEREPCVTFSLVGGDEGYSCDGPIGLVDARFQISCFAATHAVAADLGRAVKKKMNGYCDSTEGIQCCRASEPVDVPYFGDAEEQTRFGKFVEVIISYNE